MFLRDLRHALARDTSAYRQATMTRPPVVCLCGSMRFFDRMLSVAASETAAGRIVLAPFVVVDPGRQDSPDKTALDRLHLAKIDLADDVLIVNVGGYLGVSTRREIAYARRTGKPVRWLEDPATARETGGVA